MRKKPLGFTWMGRPALLTLTHTAGGAGRTQIALALCPLARRLLAVPASNADVECLFSGARLLLIFTRKSMGPSSADPALRLHYDMHGLRLWEPAPQ